MNAKQSVMPYNITLPCTVFEKTVVEGLKAEDMSHITRQLIWWTEPSGGTEHHNMPENLMQKTAMLTCRRLMK